MNCVTPREDICINQGASFFIDWEWVIVGDPDVPASYEPVDLTTYKAFMQIKESYDTDVILCSIDSLTLNEITFTPLEGKIHIRIPPQKTFLLPWKKVLHYDVKLVDMETSDAYKFKEGDVKVYPEITKIKIPLVC